MRKFTFVPPFSDDFNKLRLYYGIKIPKKPKKDFGVIFVTLLFKLNLHLVDMSSELSIDGLDKFLFELDGGFTTISSTPRPGSFYYSNEKRFFLNNVSKDSANTQKRKNIMKEMLETEVSYLEFINVVVTLFVTPLRRSLENDKPPILSKEDFQAVFQNIEEIQILNTVEYYFYFTLFVSLSNREIYFYIIF